MSVTPAELAELVVASNAIERIDAVAGEPAYDDHLAAAALALDGECDPRTLHAVLTRRLSPAHEVGTLRRIAVSIGGERPPEPGPHIAIHFGRLMEQLVAGPRDGESPEAAAARLHHEFQAVHPFRLLDSLDYQGGNSARPDRLFESEYYTWDPFVDWDTFINFSQYYGPPLIFRDLS